MTRLEELRLWVLESPLNTEEQECLLYLIEKKTEKEYRERQIKKRYKVKVDPNDKNKGTIQVDGKTYEIKLDKPSIAADFNDGVLYLDLKQLAKIKGAKARDAIVQHEVGHLKTQSRHTPQKNRHLDRSVIDKDIHDQIAMTPDDQYAAFGRELGMHAASQDRVDKDNARKRFYRRTKGQEDKEKIELRKNFRTKMEPHNKVLTHANTNEYEADRYAANRVGAKHLKRGVRRFYKQTPYQTDTAIKNSRKLLSDANKKKGKDENIDYDLLRDIQKQTLATLQKTRSKSVKMENDKRQMDMKMRGKALRDKSVTNKERQVF